MRTSNVLLCLVLQAVFMSGCKPINPGTGDSNPRPSSTVHCNDTPAGCPMQTANQPAPSPEKR